MLYPLPRYHLNYRRPSRVSNGRLDDDGVVVHDVSQDHSHNPNRHVVSSFVCGNDRCPHLVCENHPCRHHHHHYYDNYDYSWSQKKNHRLFLSCCCLSSSDLASFASCSSSSNNFFSYISHYRLGMMIEPFPPVPLCHCCCCCCCCCCPLRN